MSSAGGIRAGKVFIEVAVHADKLVRGLSAAIDKVKASAANIALGVGGAFAAVGAAAVGAGTQIYGAMQSIDATAKAADKFGLGTEQLLGLKHAAELSGVSFDTLQTALSAMQKRGFSPENFGKIAEQLKGIADPTERAQEAMKYFGGSFKDIMPLLAGGETPIKEATADLEKMGASFSRIDAAKVEMANDSMTRLQTMIEGVWQKLAIQLSPAVQYLTNLFMDVGNSLRESLGDVDAFDIAAWAMQKIADGINVAISGFYAMKGTILSVVESLLKIYYQIQRVQYALYGDDSMLSGLDDTDRKVMQFRDDAITAFADARKAFERVGDNKVIEGMVKVRQQMELQAEQSVKIAEAQRKVAGIEQTRVNIWDSILEKVQKAGGWLLSFHGRGGSASTPAATGPKPLSPSSFQQVSLSNIVLGGVRADKNALEDRVERLRKENNESNERLIDAIKAQRFPEIG